ncbi:MAG: tripartite tricarboxylate transporter permease [Planctomycetota bacterium]|jgi:TctA family transporter|nr:tripartite tricarboxylate transporter permease [Planctomycetota bacterium]
MGIAEIFTFDILWPWILSMLLGVVVGATPGLSATMAVALIIPITYYMEPLAGLSMIIGVTFTSIFTGDIPATLLRIPGTPASGVAVLDSYELAKKGRGRLALMLNLLCSAIGGFIGVTMLVFLSPPLSKIALKFTHFQYFWLGVFGLSISAALSMKAPMKGVVSACLGLLVSTIGIDATTGYARFHFGNADLSGGVSFVPAMIGLFGLSEVLNSVHSSATLRRQAVSVEEKPGELREVFANIFGNKLLIMRSSILGTIVGALPGAGADIAAWFSYGVEKKMSREPDKFGTGHVPGVIAPTSANNAAVAGAWIPALVFGIPGDSVTALVLGAMIMYNLRPGPMIFTESADLVNGLFAVAYISQIFLVPVGYIGIRIFSWLLKMPKNLVMGGVILFSIVGSYAINNNPFDVLLMTIFGVVGYFLEKNEIPLSPMILGIILGNIIENNLRIGLLKSEGSLWPFFDNPVCLFLIFCIVFIFAGEKFVRAAFRGVLSMSGRGKK